DEMLTRIRDTAFGVPDDLVVRVRSAFAKRLAADPKLRELFPELRLGSLIDINKVAPADQRKWADEVGRFLFSHVVGVGATTDQLRAMAAAAQEITKAP